MDFPGLSSFPHFERDPHTPGWVIWKTVNLNSRQICSSCKNRYLCNQRARFKPILDSSERKSSLMGRVLYIRVVPYKRDGRLTLETRITRLPFSQRRGTNTVLKIYECPLLNKTKNRLPDDPFQANSIRLGFGKRSSFAFGLWLIMASSLNTLPFRVS
jgi:hypothetical protein